MPQLVLPARRSGAQEPRAFSYRSRLFVQMLLLVAVPLLAAGALMTRNYVQQKQARDVRVLESAREGAQTQIEAVLTNLRSYYMDVLESDDYKWLDTNAAPPYSEYTQLSRIQSELRGGTWMHEYVRGYTYLNLKNGWVLSNSGMYSLSRAANRQQVLDFAAERSESLLDVEWVNNIDTPAPGYSGVQVDLSGLVLVLRTSSARSGTTELLLVNLNLVPLRTLAASWQPLGYQIMLADGSGKQILSSSVSLLSAVSDTHLPEGITEQGRWSISAGKTSANNIRYYAAVQKSNMMAIVGRFVLAALLLTVLIALIIAVCGWISDRLYRPVDELMTTASGVFGQRETDQGEFDYLAAGVARMAQDQKALQSMVGLQQGQLKQQFVQFVIRGEKGENEIRHTLEEFGVQPCPAYRLLALCLNVPDASSTEREALRLTVMQTFPRDLLNRIFLSPSHMGANIVMVVGGAEAAVPQEAETVFKAAAQVIRTGFGCAIRAGCSQTFHALHHMSAAYQEAQEALRIHAGSEELWGHMACYQPPDDDHIRNGYEVLMENEITEAMTALNKKEVRRLIDSFLGRMEEKGVRGYARQFYLQRLVSAMLLVAEKAGLSVNQVFAGRQDGLFDAIGKIYTHEAMQSFLMNEVAVPVMELLASYRQDTSSELVKNVIALIKQTGGDITLNECADKLNYHPSYIWKVLKAERDTNFTDLVNAQKLEMAKEMLLTSDMTVAQVAQTLHYANVQNFIRFFSREVGMTPGRYKKEYQTKK